MRYGTDKAEAQPAETIPVHPRCDLQGLGMTSMQWVISTQPPNTAVTAHQFRSPSVRTKSAQHLSCQPPPFFAFS